MRIPRARATAFAIAPAVGPKGASPTPVEGQLGFEITSAEISGISAKLRIWIVLPAFSDQYEALVGTASFRTQLAA